MVCDVKHKANFDQLAYALYIVDPSKGGLVLRGDANNLKHGADNQTAPKMVDGMEVVPYLMEQFMDRKEPTTKFLPTNDGDQDSTMSAEFSPSPRKSKRLKL